MKGIFLLIFLVGEYKDFLTSDGSGTYPKSDFRVHGIQPKNRLLRQVEQGFSSFFAKISDIFDEFLGALYYEKSFNKAKK